MKERKRKVTCQVEVMRLHIIELFYVFCVFINLKIQKTMNVSQRINHIQENQYDDDITVSDMPAGYFPAVTNITLPDGSTTRELTVSLFPLEQQTETTMSVNSGLFIKSQDETAVKVTV